MNSADVGGQTIRLPVKFFALRGNIEETDEIKICIRHSHREFTIENDPM
jgi:hypothetical protein